MNSENLVIVSIQTQSDLSDYEKTVFNQIEKIELKKLALPAIISNQEKISIWGIKDSKGNRQEYDKINRNDIILIKYDKKYVATGTIIHKLFDENVYSKILREKSTKKLLLFFKNYQPIDISYGATIPIFLDPVDRGFFRFPIIKLEESKITSIIKKFGSLENAINLLDRNKKTVDFSSKEEFLSDVTFSTNQGISSKRVGQKEFSGRVRKNYSNKCAICKISQKELLQAAHIIPVASNKKIAGEIKNGICMCIMCHKLFDEGLISIDKNLRIMFTKLKPIDNLLKNRILENTAIAKSKISPSPEYLEFHRIKYEFDI